MKAKITIEGKGRKSTFRAEGVGEGRGDTFKNPVTGEDHLAERAVRSGVVPRFRVGRIGGRGQDQLDFLPVRLVQRQSEKVARGIGCLPAIVDLRYYGGSIDAVDAFR